MGRVAAVFERKGAEGLFRVTRTLRLPSTFASLTSPVPPQ